MMRILVTMLVIFSLSLTKAAEQELTEEDIMKAPKENCSLNNHSYYPWVVKIWDITRNTTAMHGAILGYTAVLTTCDKNLRLSSPRFYEVIGQRILSTEDPGTYANTCFQQNTVIRILSHPSCTSLSAKGKNTCQRQASNVFCFAIMILARPFHIVRNDNPATAYPSFYFPKTPVQLMMTVKYINTQPDSGCMLPLFFERFVKKPALFYSSFQKPMKSIPYHTQCVPMNCEHEERSDFPQTDWRRKRHVTKRSYLYNADPALQAECIAIHKNVSLHGTSICLYPSWTPRMEPFDISADGQTNFYGGATITCGGAVYGMVRPEKGHMHRVAEAKFRQDYFVITTFLRIFPWLAEMKDRFTAPWIKTHFTDQLGMVKEHVDEEEKPEGPPPDLDLSKLSLSVKLQIPLFHFPLLHLGLPLMIIIPVIISYRQL